MKTSFTVPIAELLLGGSTAAVAAVLPPPLGVANNAVPATPAAAKPHKGLIPAATNGKNAASISLST